MLLRNLQERATGRRVSAGGGFPSGADDGRVVDEEMPPMSSSPTPTTPTSPPLSSRSAFANSLAAAADLAPRLRVVATCDGHDGCVNAVSFAGERGERLVTGGDDMYVRIWSSELSAWEPTSSGGGNTSLPSHPALARIKTQHSSNVFQAFFVDPSDEGSELLTCAADGAVRSLRIPRAQTERLFPGCSSSRRNDGSGAAAETSSSAVVESRLLFRHSGRVHKLALVPGSPAEFATVAEDGIVALFDLRERGRGGGSGIGGSSDSSGGGGSSGSPLTAAVGPAALAAAARAPGRSCFPPSDRACSRAAAPAGSARNVDVTLYSVSVDPLRPHLLSVGGEVDERDLLGELPAAVVIDRRMLSVPPAEAFRRRRTSAEAAGGGGGGGGGQRGRGQGGRGRGRGGRGGRGGGNDDDDDEEMLYSSDDDDDGTGPDPLAGTIFARDSFIRQILDSTRRAGREPAGTLDGSRLPAKCAAVVQGSALPAHLGAFRCGTSASRSARRHARFRARGASVTGVAFEPRGRGSLLVTVNSESAVYLVPAAIARGEARAGDAEEDADSDAGNGGGGGGGMGSSESGSSSEEESSEEEEESSEEEEEETERDSRQRRRQQQQREREREQRERERQMQRARNPAPPPFPREPRPSRAYFHRREDVDDNEHADPDGCRRFSGSGYKNEATIKAAAFVGAESELVAAGGDGGRLHLFDARSSRLRARVRTDSHTCNALREHPAAPLHLATVGIDDSVKLLAPVGERRRERERERGGSGVGSGGGRRREGQDGDGGERGGERGGGEGEGEPGDDSDDDGGGGGSSGDQSGGSGSSDDEGEREQEQRPALLSVQGVEGRSIQMMMRLAEMGIPLPSRLFPAAAAVGGEGREPEARGGEEDEEGGEEE